MKVIGSDYDGDVVKYLRHFFVCGLESPHAVAYGVTYISSLNGTWSVSLLCRGLPPKRHYKIRDDMAEGVGVM